MLPDFDLCKKHEANRDKKTCRELPTGAEYVNKADVNWKGLVCPMTTERSSRRSNGEAIESAKPIDADDDCVDGEPSSEAGESAGSVAANSDRDGVLRRASPSEERESLFACMELLFFAYRDFTSEPDEILEKYGFGRAHHRVLHFVSRNPGLRVADLLEILKITKQSLARVLKQLVDEGFIVQKAGKNDRRERHLHVTELGESLAGQLADLQMERLSRAISAAGSNVQDELHSFLFAMIGDDQRRLVSHLINKTGGEKTPD